MAWEHLGVLTGHPLAADLDAASLGFPARFAVVGDFDGDGQLELTIAPEAGKSAGNDLWVMKYDVAERRWFHLSPMPGHPMQAEIGRAHV